MDVDRKHVLIACAIAGAVLGLVLAVLQAAGAFPTSDLHGMPTGASRTTGFMLAMAPLLAAWGFTIHLRCSDAQIARYLKANAALCIAWLLIVTLKYPTGNDHLVSIMWYLYYVPMLLTSTFSLFSAMRASALDRMPVTSYAKRAVLAIDAALIMLVLTNNLHHMVFRFSFDDPLWSGSYTYGPGYWVVLGWIITQIVLFFACSFAAARRQLRSAFVPLALIVGVLGTYTVLYILRFLIGSNLALVYSILLTSCLEIALDLGILPSYYWRESMFSALPFNLRILGIDCAALVDVKRVLPASTVSVLYDCLYDFAAAAFAASNPILMLFVSDKVEADEGSGDGRHRVVEMRAALDAEESAQNEGYTHSLEELRRVLECRDVRFSLDVASTGATLAVRVGEGEGVA